MPSSPLAAVAGFVRAQLAAMGDLVGDIVRSRDLAPAVRSELAQPARRAATVIVAASAPFAPTAQARARLLRQLHASGLLTEAESDQAGELLRRHAS